MIQLSLFDGRTNAAWHGRRVNLPPEHHASSEFTSIEICAGGGGQAVGLHQAGFRHLALVENDKHAVETLRDNIMRNDEWAWEQRHCSVLGMDVKEFDPFSDLPQAEPLLRGELDLLAGGVPCPPFSHAGKQLGKDDERDLFPRMLELVELLQPRAVVIENVRGIMDPKFSEYRNWITASMEGGTYFDEHAGQWAEAHGHGYRICRWEVLEASDFGVPQLRPRAILVAFRNDVIRDLWYEWPTATHTDRVSVAAALETSMHERYEPYFHGVRAGRAHSAFERWRTTAYKRAQELIGKDGGVAPTIVGGSKKHGGADLGPSRAKAAWLLHGIDPKGIANDFATAAEKHSEDRDLFGSNGPMLTVAQAAIIQGFPPEWCFSGGKTAQYRQVGNAFPPPVAKAVGRSIIDVLAADRERGRSISA